METEILEALKDISLALLSIDIILFVICMTLLFRKR